MPLSLIFGGISIGQLILTGLSILYQRQQAKRQRRRLQQALDSQRGIDIAVKGEAQRPPVHYGYFSTTGNQVFWDLNNSYIHSNPDGSTTGFNNGLTSNINGSKNEYLMVQRVVGWSGIDGIVDVQIDGRAITDDRFNNSVRVHIRGDGDAEALATNNSNERTSTATFNDYTYSTSIYRLNREDPQFGGVPRERYYGRGQRVLPLHTLSSTATDTNSLVRTFSNNAINVLYDYMTNTVYGAGIDVSEFDLQNWREAALIANTVGQDDASVTGLVHPGMSVTRDILLYEYNGSFNSDTHAENILNILNSIVGGIIFRSEGQWKVSVPNPNVTNAVQSVLTVGPEQLINSVIGYSFPDTNDRLNKVTLEYLNASKDFESDTVTFPVNDSTLHRDLLNRDNDRILEETGAAIGQSSMYGALNFAAKTITTSRLRQYQFDMTSDGLVLEPGDIITLNNPEQAITNQTVRIDSVNVDENFNLRISASEFDRDEYAFNTSSDEIILDRPLADFTVPAPTNVVASIASGTSTINRVQLSWTGADDIQINRYLIERRVVGSTTWIAVGQTFAGVNMFLDAPLESAAYEYRVRSETRDGRRSTEAQSGSVTVTAEQLNATIDFGWSKPGITVPLNTSGVFVFDNADAILSGLVGSTFIALDNTSGAQPNNTWRVTFSASTGITLGSAVLDTSNDQASISVTALTSGFESGQIDATIIYRNSSGDDTTLMRSIDVSRGVAGPAGISERTDYAYADSVVTSGGTSENQQIVIPDSYRAAVSGGEFERQDFAASGTTSSGVTTGEQEVYTINVTGWDGVVSTSVATSTPTARSFDRTLTFSGTSLTGGGGTYFEANGTGRTPQATYLSPAFTNATGNISNVEITWPFSAGFTLNNTTSSYFGAWIVPDETTLTSATQYVTANTFFTTSTVTPPAGSIEIGRRFFNQGGVVSNGNTVGFGPGNRFTLNATSLSLPTGSSFRIMIHIGVHVQASFANASGGGNKTVNGDWTELVSGTTTGTANITNSWTISGSGFSVDTSRNSLTGNQSLNAVKNAIANSITPGTGWNRATALESSTSVVYRHTANANQPNNITFTPTVGTASNQIDNGAFNVTASVTNEGVSNTGGDSTYILRYPGDTVRHILTSSGDLTTVLNSLRDSVNDPNIETPVNFDAQVIGGNTLRLTADQETTVDDLWTLDTTHDNSGSIDGDIIFNSNNNINNNRVPAVRNTTGRAPTTFVTATVDLPDDTRDIAIQLVGLSSGTLVASDIADIIRGTTITGWTISGTSGTRVINFSRTAPGPISELLNISFTNTNPDVEATRTTPGMGGVQVVTNPIYPTGLRDNDTYVVATPVATSAYVGTLTHRYTVGNEPDVSTDGDDYRWVITGTTGAPGTRGSGFHRIQTTNDQNTLDNLNGAQIDALFAMLGLGSPLENDVFTVLGIVEDGERAVIGYVRTNGVWVAAEETITGDLIVDGTITARKIRVDNLSAISADIGTVTAGIAQSENYVPNATGTRLNLNTGDFETNSGLFRGRLQAGIEVNSPRIDGGIISTAVIVSQQQGRELDGTDVSVNGNRSGIGPDDETLSFAGVSDTDDVLSIFGEQRYQGASNVIQNDLTLISSTLTNTGFPVPINTPGSTGFYGDGGTVSTPRYDLPALNRYYTSWVPVRFVHSGFELIGTDRGGVGQSVYSVAFWQGSTRLTVNWDTLPLRLTQNGNTISSVVWPINIASGESSATQEPPLRAGGTPGTQSHLRLMNGSTVIFRGYFRWPSRIAALTGRRTAISGNAELVGYYRYVNGTAPLGFSFQDASLGGAFTLRAGTGLWETWNYAPQDLIATPLVDFDTASIATASGISINQYRP